VPFPELMHRTKRVFSITSSAQECAGSFGATPLPKAVPISNFRVEPNTDRSKSNRECGVDLKQTRRPPLTASAVTSEMGESGWRQPVSPEQGVQTCFLPATMARQSEPSSINATTIPTSVRL